MIDAALSSATGIPERVIRAIRMVESGGRDPHAIRFEPHLFRRRRPDLASRIPYTGPGPSHVRSETDRGAFERAAALDLHAAVLSTSWGAYQVLGARLVAALPGDDASDVATFWGRPDGASGELFVAWVRANPRILVPARATPPDFDGIARAYNGAGAAPRYAERLRAAYNAG